MSEERADYNPNDHMMNLKGKDYLPVAARILWCRRDHPDAIMRTTLVEWDKAEGFAMYRAEVTLPSGGHAEATATQTKKDFPQYVEKCESKALGRALGFLGYGTLAAEEEEPGNPNLSDTPVARPTRNQANGSAPTRAPQPPTPQRPPQQATQRPGVYSGNLGALVSAAWTMFEGGKGKPAIWAKATEERGNLSDADWNLWMAEWKEIGKQCAERDAALAAPVAPAHEVS